MTRTYKLAVLTSHPTQYFAPLFKYITERPQIDLTVFFLSDLSVGKFYDVGFKREVTWDVPLLEGYRHVFLPHLGSGDRLSFFRPWTYGLYHHLREGRFDALWLMGWGSLANLRALMTAKLLGIKVLIFGDTHRYGPHLPSRLKDPIKRVVFPLFYRVIDGFLASVSGNREWYMDYGVPSERIFLTPWVVDNDFFRAKIQSACPRREELRRELGLEPGRPVILYASKLQRRKRPDDLLEAYARLSSDGTAEPRPYLLFVGDGEMRLSLEARASELKWSSVRFLGFKNQSELPAYYDLCDVFVLPSEREGPAVVVAEVMNAAKAVITSHAVGLSGNLVVEGENGFVIDPRDVAALADRLRRITEDPKLAAAMGAKSLEIVSRWNFEATRAGLLRALSTLLEPETAAGELDRSS